jgi:hypothetical protein
MSNECDELRAVVRKAYSQLHNHPIHQVSELPSLDIWSIIDEGIVVE